MRTKTIAATFLLSMAVACGTSQGNTSRVHHSVDTSKSPEARYRQAVQLKLAGDAQGYHDTLLELAVDAPDSRAGRRARSTLRSVDALGALMMVNGLGQPFAPARRGLMTGLIGQDDDDDEALERLIRDVERPHKVDQVFADDRIEPPIPTVRRRGSSAHGVYDPKPARPRP